MPIKLSKRTVDAIAAGPLPAIQYDGELRGFGIRIGASGSPSWFIEYRPGAGGRRVAKKRFYFGSREFTPEEARQVAKELLASVALGGDPDRPKADLNRPWRTISKRAGLPGVRIHDLRHTHASVGAAAGLSLPIIGKLLGHTQASTTQRYAHLASDPLKEASDKIGLSLSSQMGDTPALEPLKAKR